MCISVTRFEIFGLYKWSGSLDACRDVTIITLFILDEFPCGKRLTGNNL
jgi:hypothetical protein